MAKKKQSRKSRSASPRRAPAAKKSSKKAPRIPTRRKAPAGRMDDKSLRNHLLNLLRGGGAHVDFERTMADLPPALRGVKPPGLPFTAWQLLEHMRIAQWDILEFSRDPKHVSPAWPAGYWSPTDEPPDEVSWENSLKAFRADLKGMQKLVADSKAGLFTPFPHGEGQTLLREALLVADHNAYHLGQLVMLRRLLGAWAGVP